MLTSYLCLISGFVFLAYYAGIILYTGFTSDFSLFWLAGGAALLIAGICLRKFAGTQTGTLVKTVVWILAAAALFFLSLPLYRIHKAVRFHEEKDAAYLIVLGAQVRGTRPSRALKRRIEAAADYAEKHPETILILSGGQGPDEEISEAECMKQELLGRGIAEERMILEDRSTSTDENLAFSAAMTDCAAKTTAIVTNDFHVYRACKIAEKKGYQDVFGIAAASDPIMQVHNLVRECTAIWYYRLKGRI